MSERIFFVSDRAQENPAQRMTLSKKFAFRRPDTGLSKFTTVASTIADVQDLIVSFLNTFLEYYGSLPNIATLCPIVLVHSHLLKAQRPVANTLKLWLACFHQYG